MGIKAKNSDTMTLLKLYLLDQKNLQYWKVNIQVRQRRRSIWKLFSVHISFRENTHRIYEKIMFKETFKEKN